MHAVSVLSFLLLTAGLVSCGRDQRDLLPEEQEPDGRRPSRVVSGSGGSYGSEDDDDDAQPEDDSTEPDPEKPDDPELGQELELPAPEELVGFYDVEIVDPGVPQGCTFFLETNLGMIFEVQTRLNFAVRLLDGELQSRISWDYVFAPYQPSVLTSVTPTDSDVSESHHSGQLIATSTSPVTRLELDVSEEGFVGTGRLEVWLSCGETGQVQQYAVRVGPDVTPPRAQIAPPRNELRRYFSHSGLSVRFSEQLTEDWEMGRTAWDPAALAPFLGLVFADSEEEIPVVWENWWTGGPAYLRVIDRAQVEGREVRLKTLLPAQDEAGHDWVADPTSALLYPSGPAALTHTFDTAPAGLGNGAAHVPPDAMGSPCEGRGCVLLEGSTCEMGSPDCADRPYLALVNLAQDRRYAVSRFRLFSKGENAGEIIWSSTVDEGAGTGTASSLAQPTLLAEPWNGYTHAFEWTETSDGFWPGQTEKPYVYFLPHHEEDQEPFQVAVVIDWVVASECPIVECP